MTDHLWLAALTLVCVGIGLVGGALLEQLYLLGLDVVAITITLAVVAAMAIVATVGTEALVRVRTATAEDAIGGLR